MSRCYIFHGDQVTEYTGWPDLSDMPIDSYSYEPLFTDPAYQWGHIVSTYTFSEKQWLTCPTSNVPTLYLTMALLLT